MKIEDLNEIIHNRVKSRKKNSYTNKLLKLGPKKIAQKLGEETSELIIDFLKGSKFVQYLLTKGIYFHPWHNMFLSLAHTVEDVSTTLDAVEFAMKKISEEF